MKLSKFEELIDPVILKRGENYFDNGLVTWIKEIKKESWKAQVTGSNIYKVEIILNGDEIQYSFCDCPYDFGPICKHEAAVYFELREIIDNNSGQSKHANKKKSIHDPKENTTQDIIKNLNRDTLEQFVIDQCENNSFIEKELIARFSIKNDKQERDNYKKLFQSYLNNAKDHHGFIPYSRAYQAFKGAYILLDQAKKALQNNQIRTVANICLAVIELSMKATQFTDDSGGEISTATGLSFDYLNQIDTEKPDTQSKEFLFKEYLKEAGKKVYQGWPDTQEEFCRLAIPLLDNKKERTDKLLKLLDKFINDSKGCSFSLADFILLKINVLEKSSQQEKADLLIQENMNLPEIRKKVIEDAFNQDDFQTVLKLAVQGEELARKNRYHGLVDSWQDWRLKVYQKQNDVEMIREIIRNFIIRGHFEHYQLFKNTFTDKEWKKQLDNLLNEIKDTSHKYSRFSILTEIFILENKTKQLLELVQQRPTTIDSFVPHLIKDYPKEVYQLYVTYILDEAKAASDRSMYHRVCSIIKKLIKYHGKEDAKAVIKQLEHEYRLRPAFCDELGKIRI